MKIAAVICEYNPFHNGHLHHINQTKVQTGADFIIALMSGNYVQRGTPAIMDKHLRTRLALSCGADLVIELPLWFSTASAPYFAEGAIQLLNSLGIVDFLSFGSECDDIHLLQEVCSFLLSYKEELSSRAKTYHSLGHSYPKSRELALSDLQPNQRFAAVLKEPNNILAMEYMMALAKTKSTIKPFCVHRIGGSHHETNLDPHISSASAIRTHIESNDSLITVLSQIPAICHPILMDSFQKQFPITMDDFSTILKTKILSNPDLTDFWEISPDFNDLTIKQYTHEASCSELIQRCKSKNITWSRISRNFLHIMLGMTEEHRRLVLSHDFRLYFQILGFKKSASVLISGINQKHTIPMVRHCRPLKDSLLPYQSSLLSIERMANQYYQLVLGEKYQVSYKEQQIIV